MATTAMTMVMDPLSASHAHRKPRKLPPLNASPPKDSPVVMDADTLVRRIRIVLANHSHLERAISDSFQVAWGAKQHVVETQVAGTSGGPTPVAEATVEFDTAVDLVLDILERIQLPFRRAAVLRWSSDACRTFALSRSQADAVSETKVGFIIDWVLEMLAEDTVQRCPSSFYNRQFLVGMDYDTSLASSGLQLSGPIAYGVYGNIWLHAKMKRGSERSRATPATPAASTFGVSVGKSLHNLATGKREEHVVISVPKHICRVPPELLSRRMQQLIDMEKLPHVLPLVTAYEDYEHIHLVYEPLSIHSVCSVDKMFDDLHAIEDDRDAAGMSERVVQQFIWEIMSMLKPAHARGLVHGSLRMGGCYLNDSASLDTLQILEFGLYDLFDPAPATPPLAMLTPLELDTLEPVPPYRRDFQCLAEITYLMLGGQPLCPIDSSSEQRVLHFKRGTVSFCDKVFTKISESAKNFVSELLRPPHYRKVSKLHACHEAAVLMGHRWFQPSNDEDFDQLAELYDVTMMRKYDKWRSMQRLRTVFLKIVSDNVSLYGIGRLRKILSQLADEHGKVSWAQLVNQIQSYFPSITFDLLKKVNKAFGDNTHAPVIHVGDVCDAMDAWRRKRVREVLWQVFTRAKELSGTVPLEACIEGLTSGVLHVWSRPLRVIDVVLPPTEGLSSGVTPRTDPRASDDLESRIEELVGGKPTISFQDLVGRSDARGPEDDAR